MTWFSALPAMPGVDPLWAADVVSGESMDGRMVLPTLPARGLGADSIGRTGAILADVVLDRGPRSWRVAEGPSRYSRRAHDFLQRDLDACEQMWVSPPQVVRLSAVGPWSFAARVELSGGSKVLTDLGAVRYFAESLAQGLFDLAADMRRRFGCSVEVLLDESVLGKVASGAIAAPATLMGDEGYLPAQGYREIAENLRVVSERLSSVDIPIALAIDDIAQLHTQSLTESGVKSVWLRRQSIRGNTRLDAVAALIDAGLTLELGVTPAKVESRDEFSGIPQLPKPQVTAQKVTGLWDELGFNRLALKEAVQLTPCNGFAGTELDEPAALLAAGRNSAELLNRALGDL